MANINTAITPAPVVTSRTKGGVTATGYTGNVTISLDTNPTNATLGGTLVVAASSGVATFSDLTLNRSGDGFTLRAVGAEQSGVTPRAVVSRPFSIPTKLAFTTQPTGVAEPDDILPAFAVTARDTANNTDTEYEGDITVALYTGAALGILSGLFTRAAENGVATFTGLSIDALGTYSLRATGAETLIAAKPAPVVSSTFAVGAYTLVAADVTNGAPGSSAFYGWSDGIGGSISPTTLSGQTIINLMAGIGRFGDPFTQIVLVGDALGQDFFTSVTVDAVTLTSATAVYDNSVPGFCSWNWGTPGGVAGTALFSAVDTYTVVWT